jgi:hypothetical protein
VKVGGTYKAQTSFRNDSAFATIMITYVRKEKLGSIDNNGVRKEGCQSLKDFKRIWIDIHGSWQPDTEVFVVGFRCV